MCVLGAVEGLKAFIKFSDDRVILSSLRSDDCPSRYHEETVLFKSWCILNTNKTREMICDSGGLSNHDPITIHNRIIEQVSSYKYLGVFMDENGVSP